MGDDIKLPPSFTRCEKGKCPEKKHPEKGGKEKGVDESLWQCEQGGKECSGPCYCQMFVRLKGADHAKDEWKAFPMDRHGIGTFYPNFDYECVCVKPVLPDGYVLCAGGSCEMESVGAEGLEEINCKKGKCGDDGKGECRMFKMKRPTLTDPGGAWEVEREPGKFTPDKKYYYRCFCTTLKETEKKEK